MAGYNIINHTIYRMVDMRLNCYGGCGGDAKFCVSTISPSGLGVVLMDIRGYYPADECPTAVAAQKSLICYVKIIMRQLKI